MSAISFESTLYTIDTWTIMRLPEDASKQLPSRGQVMVKGTINAVPVHTALEPDGRVNSSHWMRIDDAMQQAIQAHAGDTVHVTIEATKDWPEPDIPADWDSALQSDHSAHDQWQDITPMARWEWLRWINSTKEPTTRKRRIEVSCSKLRAGSRRPCCFNRNMCCVPDVSKSGVLLQVDN